MILLKKLLLESKQSIVNLGFPEIIAALFYEKFGNKAYQLAKWYKEYYAAGDYYKDKKDWFYLVFYTSSNKIGVGDFVKLYNATFKKLEDYKKERRRLDLSIDSDETYDADHFDDLRKYLIKEIKDNIFDNSVFFLTFVLVKDFISGKLKNIVPYKDMKFYDAVLKYDEKRVFSEMVPLKVYPNGYKWINVGKRCELVGYHMKNCGSAGLMSLDVDRTIICLFSSENKPHVLITYSPNENRLSGEQGIASSMIKDEYVDYVVDLAKVLDTKIDITRVKSKLLKLKFIIGDNLKKIKRLKTELFNEYFQFQLNNGKIFFTDSDTMVSAEDFKRFVLAIKEKQLVLPNTQVRGLNALFNHLNTKAIMNFGIKYISIELFSK
jgi:hypothetical protein